MSARELNKRIKLYQKQNEFDGFAGQTASKDILLTETWAKIETFNATKTSGPNSSCLRPTKRHASICDLCVALKTTLKRTDGTSNMTTEGTKTNTNS